MQVSRTDNSWAMKCLRQIYENNILIIIGSCASIFSSQHHTFKTTDGEMMDAGEMKTIAALNPLPADMTIGFYHCVRAHPYHRGLSPLWDGAGV